MAELEEHHDSALILNNAIVRCDTTYLRKHDAVETHDNREHPDSTAFQTKPGERLTWSDTDAAAYGVDNIPFDSIGLYEDTWRQKTGGDWTLGTRHQD